VAQFLIMCYYIDIFNGVKEHEIGCFNDNISGSLQIRRAKMGTSIKAYSYLIIWRCHYLSQQSMP